jgi:DNA mismatch endonuclease, patch repair protein
MDGVRSKKIKTEYLRDGRAPIPKTESISRVMRANKAKNTKPEIIFRKALWNNGIKGYRLNWKKAPGRPDIAFPAKKIAIFVNGCFWHRCPFCNYHLPKTNTPFWREKFARNMNRDKQKIKDLEKLGWQAFTIWECEIKKDAATVVEKFKNTLS